MALLLFKLATHLEFSIVDSILDAGFRYRKGYVSMQHQCPWFTISSRIEYFYYKSLTHFMDKR